LSDASLTRRARLAQALPLRALIPNAITLAALCFGLTGVRLAMSGEWEKAIAAVIAAGVLDGIDGRIARLLKGQSRFGAELDSLSDLTAHGVAPALILYLWSLQYLPKLGWLIALALAACCALRLARFNTTLDAEDSAMKRAGFLMGVPAPVGAGLAMSPMCLDLWLETDFFRQPAITAIIVGGTALLLVSSLPTWSWKKARIRPEWRVFALLGVGVIAGGLFSAPWMTLSLIAVVYAASIPFSVMAYERVKRAAAPEPTPAPETPTAP
jgi:CDP-diacylglycerol--serine O-phosphatidyltransferase